MNIDRKRERDRKAYDKKYRNKPENKKIIFTYNKEWRKNNPEKFKIYHREWATKNPEKIRISRRKAMQKKLSTVRGKLSNNISRVIRKSLANGSKNNKHWESIVEYTTEQLKNHLEKNFLPGMTWENRNLWQIDHKIPISVFNFQTENDIDFKKCWALKNLRPLWKIDNIKKSNKLDKPFQPSLRLTL